MKPLTEQERDERRRKAIADWHERMSFRALIRSVVHRAKEGKL